MMACCPLPTPQRAPQRRPEGPRVDWKGIRSPWSLRFIPRMARRPDRGEIPIPTNPTRGSQSRDSGRDPPPVIPHRSHPRVWPRGVSHRGNLPRLLPRGGPPEIHPPRGRKGLREGPQGRWGRVEGAPCARRPPDKAAASASPGLKSWVSEPFVG